jgi:16S rRNA (guanine527-N7)-methyltransferase
MKAACSEKELEQVYDPFTIEKIITLVVPGLDAVRQLIIIRTAVMPDKKGASENSTP